MNAVTSPHLGTIQSIVIEALRVTPAQVTVGARLFDDLGAESIDMLDIRFRIEQAFGFKIEQDAIRRSLGEELSAAQVREYLTVGALVAYVDNRLRAPRAVA